MYGAFGSPITPLAEWFSSTMMNTRSSRTWSPPDPWLATGVAPLGADSPTVSAAATPATDATARTFARLVLKTMLTLPASAGGPGQSGHPPFLLFCAGSSQDDGTEWIKFVTG